MISIYSVSAQKGYSVDLDIKTEPGEKITLNETEIGLTVFGSVNEKTKIKNTFKYKLSEGTLDDYFYKVPYWTEGRE